MVALLLVPPAYASVRVKNTWSGQQAVDLATALVGPERAESLEYRFKCENLIAAHALQQPIFGWGGWMRNMAYFPDPEAPNDPDRHSGKIVPVDGLWMGYLGGKGFVGLTLFFTAIILPAALYVRRFPARSWGDPRLAAGQLAAVLLGVYMVDCLMNGYVNIIYATLAGGLAGLDPVRFGAIVAARAGAPAATGRAAARPASGPVDSRWRTAAAPWAARSSRTAARTRRRPPGGRPSTS
jgi:hypothetical protein